VTMDIDIDITVEEVPEERRTVLWEDLGKVAPVASSPYDILRLNGHGCSGELA
jgi:hypothetical protein